MLSDIAASTVANAISNMFPTVAMPHEASSTPPLPFGHPKNNIIRSLVAVLWEVLVVVINKAAVLKPRGFRPPSRLVRRGAASKS